MHEHAMTEKRIAEMFEEAIEHHRCGRMNEARDLYRMVVAANPGYAYAVFLLGKAEMALGNFAEAVKCFRSAIGLNPTNPDYYLALAKALQDDEKYEEAALQYKRVLELKPDSAEAYIRLGDLFRTIGRFESAERSYRMALRFDGRNIQALTNIGTLLRMKGRYTEAIANYRQALYHRPECTQTLNNLALCLTDQGNLDEARQVYRAALEKEPALAALRSNYLLCLCYDPDVEYTALFEEHKKFGMLHGAAPAEGHRLFNAGSGPDRRLRVGFISPDFRRHSVSFFSEPILAHLDRAAFETVCYSQVEFADSVTERLRSMSGQWRDIRTLDDERCVETIRNDSIDILIELAGHTAGNRLTVLARRAAPVQATYCGYPNTTGLAQVDYRITDSIADPAGEEAFYTERLMRLAGCFLCYTPPAEAPDVLPGSAGSGAGVTLASFNARPKINRKVIALWAAILRTAPETRLLLKARGLDDPGARERICQLFAANGVDTTRLDLKDHIDSLRERLDLYNHVDICLDTFPYTGTTTTCEALWMGAPVVTLAGKHHAQRVGASILHAIGLNDLAAGTEDGYIDTVCALVRDADRRGAVRTDMRRRILKSGLCDGRAFAKKFGDALMKMWREAGEPASK